MRFLLFMAVTILVFVTCLLLDEAPGVATIFSMLSYCAGASVYWVYDLVMPK